MDIKQVQDVCKGIDIGVPLKIEKKESSAKKESETKTGTEVTDEGLKPSLS
ncbi:MAG: hypothetical protein L6Q33_15785 [Bacteriovoracaceae bacterium]|nr:hypothetical protein [Bacteriovoracaceae bacterium]